MSNERGISTAVGYVLTLGISALLVTGLLASGGSYIDEQRERTVESQLEVIGQQTAANVERADRMVRAAEKSSDPTVALSQSLPNTVAGTTYRITLDQSNSEVSVASADPSVTVTVAVDVDNAIETSSAGGGNTQVLYDTDDDHLEVQNG